MNHEPSPNSPRRRPPARPAGANAVDTRPPSLRAPRRTPALIMLVLLATGVGARAHAATDAAPPPVHVVENLTLEQALTMAEHRQPQLTEAQAKIEAAAGRARQAGAFPNPEAIFGAQQLPVTRSQPDDQEYVAGLGLTVPLGRRLSRAREAEMLDREVLARGHEVRRRDIRKRVHGAFATALFQEKARAAQGEIRHSLERVRATTQARLDAGDAIREDLARADLELARAAVEWQRADSLRAQALLALASAMGEPALNVLSLAGSMDAALELPTLEQLAADLPSQPEVELADADVRARGARVDAAKAERIPDVRVELLYHRLEASGADTVDVGFSVPLPLFHRNQGRLREAEAEQAAAVARAQLARNDLATRLREAHLQLTAALAASRAYTTELLPMADTLLRTAEARYAAGDIGLAELSIARRDRAVVQWGHLESLRDVMQAWANLRPHLEHR